MLLLKPSPVFTTEKGIPDQLKKLQQYEFFENKSILKKIGLGIVKPKTKLMRVVCHFLVYM